MRHFDLVIIGTGSANSIPGPEFDHWNIAVVESGLFGGTCLNVGCIPTKMFVYPADIAEAVTTAGPLNLTGPTPTVDWPGLRDRIFGRIDSIEAGGREYRTGDRNPNVTVFAGHGRFSGDKQLTVELHDGGTAEFTADRVVIGAGSRATVPPFPGLADRPGEPGENGVVFHTSDTIMRIDELPASIVIVGGGYIAAEFAHVFASFGTRVTQIARGPHLLGHHDADISVAYTAVARHRYDVRTRTTVTSVEAAPGGGRLVHLDGPDGADTVHADQILIATGRTPNGDRLDLDRTGVAMDKAGRIVVDEYQRTGIPDIWALGDVSSHYPLKHVANAEARTVRHNLAHPEQLVATDHRFVPAAVFTHPQIASVGCTQGELVESGQDFVVAQHRYGHIAAGWAREDETGFVKIIADPQSGKLLGAHIMGPEAATVIQPLIQAMSFGQTAAELARGQYWIHPALTEVLENALLALPAPLEYGELDAAEHDGGGVAELSNQAEPVEV